MKEIIFSLLGISIGLFIRFCIIEPLKKVIKKRKINKL
jgi:hypothetical protein